MKDRPILFSAPMVRALLDGRKTQTRRLAWSDRDHPKEDNLRIRVPAIWQKVKPGELLWVKETFAEEHPLAVQDGRYSQEGRAGIPGPPPVNYRVIYRADGEPLQVWRNADGQHPYFTLAGPASEIDAKHSTVTSNFTRHGKAIHWDSPLHHPRKWSRLTLAVTETRLQRLQDISHEDAEAEGVKCDMSQWGFRDHYRDLWERLHGSGSWASTPEVVALTFTVHKQNIDDLLKARAAA